jgi:hypothetical protein
MKDVCSPINKPKGPSAGSPAQRVKVKHAPIYGPPSAQVGNAPRASLTADVTVRTGGRNLSDPDPFPPPDRAA